MKKMIGLFLAVIMLVSVAGASISAVRAQNTGETPTLNIYACNLSFNDSVYIKYAISYENATADDILLLVWTDPQSAYTFANKSGQLISTTTEIINGTSCLIFDYKEFAAKQMTDVLYARAYTKVNGVEYYSAVKKYSIIQYAYNKLGKTATASTDDNLKGLLDQMLAYGASAQTYFNYKTDRLATADFYQVKVSGGLLEDQCSSGLYLAGDQVTVTAPKTDAEGKSFDHWTNSAGATVGYTATYTYTVGSQNDILTAVYTQQSVGLEFDSNGDGTACLVGMGECTDANVVIPSTTPDGDTVTEIDSSAFAGEAITSVTIPATVTDIGRRAFQGCDSLTDVYYGGTQEQWEEVSIGSNNQPLQNATVHFAGVETFTVTFKDWDGTILDEQTVEKGNDATPPANPTRGGYTFNGWSGIYTNITANTTVTAVYTQNSSNKYTVTFYDYNGTTVLKSQEVNSGANATPPANPTKSGASFVGWSGSYTDITANTSVRAVYSDEKNILYWDSEDGATGETITVTLKIGGDVSLCRYFLSLKYDNTVLQLVDYDAELSIYMSTVNPEKDGYGNIIGDAAGNINLSWASSSNKTKKADIIELQFKVLDGSKPTEISTVVNALMNLSGSEQVDVEYSAVNVVINEK